MLNSLRDLSSRSRSAEGNDGDDAQAVLDPILQDGESVQYVQTNSKGIETTTDGRTTTIKPDSGYQVYNVVTDHRVLFLMGGDTGSISIDVEFDMESVTLVDARDGLLSTTFVVGGINSTVKFTPSDGPDTSEVVDYIDRIGSSWSDLYDALAGTREAIEAFEASLQADEDGEDSLRRARSRLSNAHYCATRHDDGPVEQMLALIEPVETELDQIQVEARLDRVDDLLAAAEAGGSFDDTVRSLIEAGDRLDKARRAIDDDALESDAAQELIEDREVAIDQFAASVLADVEDCCHSALGADDASVAAEAWETAFERYRTLLDADWDGLAGVGADAVRFQLSWVVGRRVEALTALAAEREAEGNALDDDGDDATEHYEHAKAHVESARTLADEHPHIDADRFDDRIAELEEKIEVSEWQWGNAD